MTKKENQTKQKNLPMLYDWSSPGTAAFINEYKK